MLQAEEYKNNNLQELKVSALFKSEIRFLVISSRRCLLRTKAEMRVYFVPGRHEEARSLRERFGSASGPRRADRQDCPRIKVS